jgi:beta-glucosidase
MSISISKNMWQQIITTIHNVTRNSTRLKIPVIYGIDSLHGANYINEATLFPHQLNQAATFNVDVVREIGN